MTNGEFYANMRALLDFLFGDDGFLFPALSIVLSIFMFVGICIAVFSAIHDHFKNK